jgi:hypothetical protein
MTFDITTAGDGPSRRVNAHGSMWLWTRWMALYDQPLTQRKLRAIEPRRKWVRFNGEEVGNVPTYLWVIQ